MSATHAQRVDELFRQAVVLPSDQRTALLVEACNDDADLRAEVEDLLSHDELAGPEFLRPPTPHQAGAGPDAGSDEPDPLIGTDVGQYHIIAVIASGGMGTVYEAVQRRPRRVVAVKVINTGLVSRWVMRRFEHESQFLARLRHPNIASIHEAGTHRPASGDHRTDVAYFAMEYIPNAESIPDYAQRRQLSTQSCLTMFIKICDAVHHGHQQGIIHRDLKPGNILVDPDGEPKIIDFGVARTTDADVALTTACTDIGQLVGTVQYMSPEQCVGDSHDIDTRSDVYALGVVLYELLCGRLPYDISCVPVFEATRIIREIAPDRPSTIDRKLRGDLETIVLTAIEKDREKRYQSAADLAKDLRRYLNREPIEARPPGVSLRMLRWTMRHPVATTSSVCLFIAASVLVFTVLATWLYNSRPYELETLEQGKEVRLLSMSGQSLKVWRPDEPRPKVIVVGGLVKRPMEMGGERVAVLGFSGAHGATAHPNSLCVFDVDGDLENPLWERHIEDEDLPAAVRRIQKLGESDFGVVQTRITDIFVDSRYEGDEIVAIHKHESFTLSVLRVYDLQGEILYQVWFNVFVNNVYWMDEARLLVMAGAAGSASWRDRGYPHVRHHPNVVFAVSPETGFVKTEFLAEQPGDDSLSPAWYNCVMPPRMSDVFDVPRLYAPRSERGRHVKISMETSRFLDELAGISWVMNEFGEVVPDSVELNDLYQLYQSKLPDSGDIEFGELPPVVSVSLGNAGGELNAGGE